MGIDIINARNDIRAMRVNNLYGMKSEAVDKLIKELRKKAYPYQEEKVYSFDEIDKLFKGK